MKSVAVFAVLAALAASPAFAQSSGQALPPAPPPPGMNDPGVKAVPQPAAKTPAKPAAGQATAPRDARGEAPPEVTVHKQGDDTVQEYRRSGTLYMVVVTPKTGVPQTYMVDANGTWHASGAHEPVRPVMYKVMEWGKSKPAEAESQSGDGH